MSLGKDWMKTKLDLPREVKELPNTDVKVPYFFIGDKAFQLKINFMRPFPGRNLDYKKRIFNYRLSRARRCIENAFGILVARWRIFQRPISCHPKYVDCIVQASIVLHNFLMAQTQKSIRNLYCPSDFVDQYTSDGSIISGHWREEIPQNNDSNFHRNYRNSIQEAYNIRNKVADYFPEEQISWQHDYVTRGTYGDL